jgi:hypothetical protein
MPLYQAVVAVFPDCAPLLDGLKENHAMWASRDPKA